MSQMLVRNNNYSRSPNEVGGTLVSESHTRVWHDHIDTIIPNCLQVFDIIFPHLHQICLILPTDQLSYITTATQ